jgi:hypothetical protein
VATSGGNATNVTVTSEEEGRLNAMVAVIVLWPRTEGDAILRSENTGAGPKAGKRRLSRARRIGSASSFKFECTSIYGSTVDLAGFKTHRRNILIIRGERNRPLSLE